MILFGNTFFTSEHKNSSRSLYLKNFFFSKYSSRFRLFFNIRIYLQLIIRDIRSINYITINVFKIFYDKEKVAENLSCQNTIFLLENKRKIVSFFSSSFFLSSCLYFSHFFFLFFFFTVSRATLGNSHGINVEYRLRSSSIFRYLRGQSTRVSRKNYLCRTYATKKNQAFLYVSCRFVILANIILLGGC